MRKSTLEIVRRNLVCSFTLEKAMNTWFVKAQVASEIQLIKVINENTP